MEPAETKIKRFITERDEVLLSLDIDRMIAFHTKHNPTAPNFSNREVAEIAMHKARTGAKSLPKEARILSYRWLKERNYTTLDDGDLSD